MIQVADCQTVQSSSCSHAGWKKTLSKLDYCANLSADILPLSPTQANFMLLNVKDMCLYETSNFDKRRLSQIWPF